MAVFMFNFLLGKTHNRGIKKVSYARATQFLKQWLLQNKTVHGRELQIYTVLRLVYQNLEVRINYSWGTFSPPAGFQHETDLHV